MAFSAWCSTSRRNAGPSPVARITAISSAKPLLDRLLEALRAEGLSRKVHGLRLFVAHQDGRLHTNEVLLDSETWPAGEAVVADSPAPLPDGMVAVRVFGLLVPAGE
jgi:hypothetical protein